MLSHTGGFWVTLHDCCWDHGWMVGEDGNKNAVHFHPGLCNTDLGQPSRSYRHGPRKLLGRE
eukprot:228077-Chlamydomonas_euryale.AAC.8